MGAMAEETKQFTKAQKVWGGLFIASVAILLALLILNYLTGRYLLASGTPTGSVAPAWLATASALASLIGFISTTVLDWRREAREAKAAKLEVMRTRLELEKTRLELEKLRREQAEDAD